MKKGFTLVELLAVIVILAIILAIAVPTINSLILNSSKSTLESNAKMILNAIRLKTLENSSFDPTTINETNIKSLLNIDDSNYKDITVTTSSGTPYITISGKNKWDNLVVGGTFDNLVVHEGLVMWLDAGNLKSYPGSGTTWYDLSGNNNNAVANGNVANPIWNSGGYFAFSATGSGVNNGFLVSDSSTIRNLNYATVELVFTLESKTLISGDTDWMCLFSKDNGSRGNQIPAISIHQGTSGYRYFHVETPSAFNSATNLFTDYTGNVWYHIVAVVGGSSYGYLNNTVVSTGNFAMTGNTNPIYIGTDSGQEMFKGKMAIVRFYNRKLSASEIQQNFNATRSRFGL